MVLFANPKVLESLAKRQRGALTGAAKAAFAATFALQQKDEAEAATTLCRRGVKFETADKADLAALRRGVQPVYDRLGRRAETKAAIAQIEAIRADAGSAPAPACKPGAQAGGRGGQATPIDGVYRTEVTTAQLKRTPGFKAFEANPGNVGRFKMELRNGRFRISGASDGSEVIGTYAVNGDGVAIEFNGEGPYRYGWSLYRGALTLHMRGDGPTPLVVHPWRREGGQPSLGTRTAIDGVWTMNATRAQVVKEMMARQELTKAMADSDLVSENYGRWRFTFDRGQLYYTQAAEGSKRWTRARYIGQGPHVHHHRDRLRRGVAQRVGREDRRVLQLPLEPLSRPADADAGGGRDLAGELHRPAVAQGRLKVQRGGELGPRAGSPPPARSRR